MRVNSFRAVNGYADSSTHLRLSYFPLHRGPYFVTKRPGDDLKAMSAGGGRPPIPRWTNMLSTAELQGRAIDGSRSQRRTAMGKLCAMATTSDLPKIKFDAIDALGKVASSGVLGSSKRALNILVRIAKGNADIMDVICTVFVANARRGQSQPLSRQLATLAGVALLRLCLDHGGTSQAQRIRLRLLAEIQWGNEQVGQVYLTLAQRDSRALLEFVQAIRISEQQPGGGYMNWAQEANNRFKELDVTPAFISSRGDIEALIRFAQVALAGNQKANELVHELRPEEVAAVLELVTSWRTKFLSSGDGYLEIPLKKSYEAVGLLARRNAVALAFLRNDGEYTFWAAAALQIAAIENPQAVLILAEWTHSENDNQKRNASQALRVLASHLNQLPLYTNPTTEGDNEQLSQALQVLENIRAEQRRRAAVANEYC